MAETGKYIVVETKDIPTIIMFPSHLTHADFAARVMYPVLSAGFVRVCTPPGSKRPHAFAYGESVSLKLKADEARDSILANKLLDLHESTA